MKKFFLFFLAAAILFGSAASCFATNDLTHPFRPGDIPTGLQGWWKFDNNANDSGPNGYTLTANGSPTYTTDTYWKEGEKSTHLVTGSSQYFSRSGASSANIVKAGTHTVVGWVKLNSASSNYDLLSTSQSSGGGFGLRGYANSIGDFHIYINWSSIGVVPPLFVPYCWTHFAVVMNDSDHTVTVYKNGNFHVRFTGVAAINAGQDLTIGNYYKPTADYKDFAVWDVALTPQQIKSLALGIDLSRYTYRPSDVSTQPTHWWKMNEYSGNRSDSVLTGPLTLTDNNTVLSSGGYVEGVGALFAAATNEYFSVSSASGDFDYGTGNFTHRVRFKANTLPTSGNYATLKARWGAAGQYGDVIYLRNVSGTYYIDFFYSTNGTAYFNSDTTFVLPALSTGVFYDMVLKRSGTNVTCYLDGIQAGSAYNISTNNIFASSANFQIGVLSTSSSPFDGVMEDVAVWKGYALTDAEIKKLACGLSIQQKGIVNYWKLDETSGDRLDAISSKTLTDTNTVTYIAGMVGNAAYFTSANSETLNRAQDTDFDFGSSELTMLTWIKPKYAGAPNGNGYTMLSKYSSPTGWYWYINSYWFDWSFAASGSSSVTARGPSFASDTWHHGGVIKNGPYVKFYQDGAQIGTDQTAAATYNGANTTLKMGTYDANYMYGGMDEFLIAKRWLRPEEIKAVYLKGLNGKEATSAEKGTMNLKRKGHFFFFF